MGVTVPPMGEYPVALSARPLPKLSEGAMEPPSELVIVLLFCVCNHRNTLSSSREPPVRVGPVSFPPPRNSMTLNWKYPSALPESAYMVGEASEPPSIIGILLRKLPSAMNWRSSSTDASEARLMRLRNPAIRSAKIRSWCGMSSTPLSGTSSREKGDLGFFGSRRCGGGTVAGSFLSTVGFRSTVVMYFGNQVRSRSGAGALSCGWGAVYPPMGSQRSVGTVGESTPSTPLLLTRISHCIS
ncbi:hypothetical protein NRB20_75420 [Nocardia sp. RB20]|uniref:Uncharacterized protein n=1 Tax=Nocardia macrotermitis TaxID=2585198 RepID=A0A7K0DFC8_9NOCA|nr:hypothetical protein [Nocardia macrotermitis]